MRILKDDPISYEVKDVLYESDNIFEIPNLLIEQQAGKPEALLDELDAYDEMGDDLIKWFYGKYKSQAVSE